MKCIVKDNRQECDAECGVNMVCDLHRKTINAYQKKKADIEWHNHIVEQGQKRNVYGYVEYRCHHCLQWFPRNEVCGDHYPYTKGAYPQLRYSTKNGVTTCKPCNQSDSKTRKPAKQEEAEKNCIKHVSQQSCGMETY